MLTLNSASSLSTFSRVVQETYNSAIMLSSDIGIVIDKKSYIEKLIAKLFNFKNLSMLHQAFKHGYSINSNDFKKLKLNYFTSILGNEVSKLNDDNNNWFEESLTNFLFLSFKSAICRYDEPTAVNFSNMFKLEHPVFVSDSIRLSLDDFFVFPYSEDISVFNSVEIFVGDNRFVSDLKECFSDPYVLNLLHTLRACLPCVWLNEHMGIMDSTFSNNLSEIPPDPRFSKFAYYNNLLNIYFRYDKHRLNEWYFGDSSLDLNCSLYLLQSTDNVAQIYGKDLPAHISIVKFDNNEFIESLTRNITFSLFSDTAYFFDSSRDKAPKLNLPYYFKKIIGPTAINQAFAHLRFSFSAIKLSVENREIYRITFDEKSLDIEFLKPKFHVWVNYRQKYAHKVDRLLDGEYDNRKKAKEDAIAFLMNNETLSPDFKSLSSREFKLFVVDTSKYLHVVRDYFYSVDLKVGIGSDNKRLSEKWKAKLSISTDSGSPSYIAGSGLATTSLRSPMRLVSHSNLPRYLLTDEEF